MRLITILAIAIIFAAPASAQQLVCFEKNKLHQSLDRITNVMQLLAASDYKITRGGSCAWTSVPRGQFTAYWSGWYITDRFIFPTYELDYDTDNLRRYSVDGIYKFDDWIVDSCPRRGYWRGEQCLYARSCDTWRRFLKQGGRELDFMVVPRACAGRRG